MRTMTFIIEENESLKFKEWAKEQDKIAVELQQERVKEPHEFCRSCWAQGYPYEGASGGRYTYSATSTSMGTVLEVKDNITQNKIDLTDYESW